MLRRFPSLRTLALVPLLAVLARAGVTSLPFPLAGPDEALRPQPGLLEELAGKQEVRLTNVALPGGPVSLELQRVVISAAGAQLAVDGERVAGALEAGLTLWSGHVAGEPGSEVFLAFSRSGSRGWVRRDGTLLHLLARPGDDGAWSASSSRWASEEELLAGGTRLPEPCQALATTRASLPRAATPVSSSGAPTTDGGTLPLLEARVVIETDFQFFQIFGNVDAARVYALSLLGAVSSRYREQIGVILTFPYLGLHSSAADGWDSPDSGSSIDMLYEFQDKWGASFQNLAPAHGDLYHFLSGANLGGGVAWLPALCDQDYGFAVSGNLGGSTPFPIAVGPLNWDFIVVAHETGHNFNALHTHDYCPPLDECAPAGYFGGCQSQQVCTTQGTIMSYCHLCGAGMLNETTFFHPQSVADMRAQAEAGCLQPFEGVLVTDLGFAKPGSGGTPELAVSYTKSPALLHVDSIGLPGLQAGALFLSTTQLNAPFKGGVLVPFPDFKIFLVSSPAGQLPLALPVSFSFPTGLVLYAQEWFKNGGPGYAATNGVRFELIKP
jgi:hypothetical protein